MKTVGIIGGMGWKSSLEYYRLMNEEIQRNLGELYSCKSILYSVNFHEIAPLQNLGQWEQIGEKMIEIARHLEGAGADFLMLASNTIHRVAEDIEKGINIPLLHIADVTGEAIRKRGLREVGLLGTKFTMEEDFYRKRLEERYGVKVLTPPKAQREILQDIIFRELVLGELRETSRKRIKGMMMELEDQGARGIILGCTELPLLIREEDTPLPIFNTTELHARAGAREALKGVKR